MTQLNRYFTKMVDVVTARAGIVDKYIDDAVMALFGHSVKHEDDVPQALVRRPRHARRRRAVQSGAEEERTARHSRPVWDINYGPVTVGNIGCEQKMGFTVIGDQVNLASRAQGMCKVYRQPLIFTEMVYRKLNDMAQNDRGPAGMRKMAEALLPCRLIDIVMVKGKNKPVRLYTVGPQPDCQAEAGLDMHNTAMEQYLGQSFSGAAALFDQVQKLLPGDFVSDMMARALPQLRTAAAASRLGGRRGDEDEMSAA